MHDQIDYRLRDRWLPAPAGGHVLPAHALAWLRTETGLRTPEDAAATEPPRATKSTMPDAAATALRAVLGAQNLLLDGESRLGRTGGLSYVDLVRRRAGGELAAPDAVAMPADPEQVVDVLRCCVEHDIAVVPFGGGTSVVGGVSALRGGKAAVLAVDLARLNRLVSVDPVSRLATLQAGVRGPEADRLLAEHGMTLGHVPQSYERASIGGYAAARSAGQVSCGYGHFPDLVAGVRMATPRGELNLGVAPVSAAGPDLRQLALGSEGAFGVITEVTVRVAPIPARRHYEGYVLDGWERGSAAVRALAQRGVLADVTRLSDVDETSVSLVMAGGLKGGALRGYLRLRGIAQPCLLVLGWEVGDRAELARRRRAAARVLRGRTAARLGKPLGEAWRRGRFNGPRQRDSLMDVGVCVETLETAAYWSDVDELRTAVRDALCRELSTATTRPVIMCHVSHAYVTGASLYFTVLVPASVTDPVAQWQRAKDAASAAIAGTGGGPRGTISHHHGTGTDHAGYLAAEIGELGVDVLAAVKSRVDPTGIMNPGKLIASPRT